MSPNGAAVGNRKPDIGCKCLASGCMAWRWFSPAGGTDQGEPRPAHGYCGLAGPAAAP
jgi:hypothetical protein